ncbi:MAG TPA: hypothetical protein VN934_09400 [Candidatus Tumulicola sp.]|nr:hypothetical protein [Candidatus Tumulicola sp.]
MLRRLMCAFALVVALAVLPAMGDVAPQSNEDCLNCKHLRCLESLLDQRKAIANAYDELATSPVIQVRDASGTPVDVIDDTGMSETLRRAELNEIVWKLAVFDQFERARLLRLPSPECGAPATEEVAARTDQIKCEIQTAPLNAAMAAMPCRQLAEMIRAHEIQHASECNLRKHHRNDQWPYKWPTPAGVAHEEAAAYRVEAATIQKLIDKIQEPRLESEAVIVFRSPAPMGTIRMTQTGLFTFKVSEGTPQPVTGEGVTSLVVDTSGSQCRMSGLQGIRNFKVGGQISGGVATLKVTEVGYKATTFRITCPRGFGWGPPAPQTPGTIQMKWKDGESVSKTLFDMPQGTGKLSYTLHLKCKKRQG